MRLHISTTMHSLTYICSVLWCLIAHVLKAYCSWFVCACMSVAQIPAWKAAKNQALRGERTYAQHNNTLSLIVFWIKVFVLLLWCDLLISIKVDRLIVSSRFSYILILGSIQRLLLLTAKLLLLTAKLLLLTAKLNLAYPATIIFEHAQITLVTRLLLMIICYKYTM